MRSPRLVLMTQRRSVSSHVRSVTSVDRHALSYRRKWRAMLRLCSRISGAGAYFLRGT